MWSLVPAVAAAFALRVALVAASGAPRGIGDEICYLFGIRWARLGIVWPRCLECRPPGYGLVLHWLGLAGLDRLDMLFAQAALSAATLVPLWALGRRWVGKRATLIACWLVALYPPLIVYAALFLSETLYLFCFVTALALLARPGASRPAHAAAGLAFAAAVLTRGAGKLAFGAAFLWLLAVPWWPRRERWLRAGLVLAGFALPVAGWTARNVAVHGEAIPFDCQTWYNIWQGNRPPGLGYMAAAKEYYAVSESPSAREAYARARALAAIRSDPAGWLVAKIRTQVPRAFGWEHHTIGFFAKRRLGPVPAWMPAFVRRVEIGAWAVLVAGGLLGFVVMGPDPRRRLACWIGAAVIVTHVVAFGVPRHRLPLAPLLALGVGRLAAGGRRHSGPQTSVDAGQFASSPSHGRRRHTAPAGQDASPSHGLGS